ncbi:hypothetical protein BH24DEI2_BH24DEI2_08760 [soil metagenome]
MACCDVNGIDRIFRGNLVTQEKRAFLKNGLNERQQGFFEQVAPTDKTVLDIGCGVGALGTSALQQGAREAVFVDVSRAYLAAARGVVEYFNLSDRASFQQGDFTDLSVRAADLVTLDRVVCCYPDATRLLEKAAAHSRHDLVFSYPRPTWWLRAGRTLLNLGVSVFGQRYRFYLHDEKTLLDAAQSAGHVLRHRARHGLWQVLVLSRSERSAPKNLETNW